MLRHAARLTLVILAVAAQPGEGAAADKDTRAANDFFETEIRPLLVERCQKCHGEKSPSPVCA